MAKTQISMQLQSKGLFDFAKTPSTPPKYTLAVMKDGFGDKAVNPNGDLYKRTYWTADWVEDVEAGWWYPHDDYVVDLAYHEYNPAYVGKPVYQSNGYDYTLVEAYGFGPMVYEDFFGGRTSGFADIFSTPIGQNLLSPNQHWLLVPDIANSPDYLQGNDYTWPSESGIQWIRVGDTYDPQYNGLEVHTLMGSRISNSFAGWSTPAFARVTYENIFTDGKLDLSKFPLHAHSMIPKVDRYYNITEGFKFFKAEEELKTLIVGSSPNLIEKNTIYTPKLAVGGINITKDGSFDISEGIINERGILYQIKDYSQSFGGKQPYVAGVYPMFEFSAHFIDVVDLDKSILENANRNHMEHGYKVFLRVDNVILDLEVLDGTLLKLRDLYNAQNKLDFSSSTVLNNIKSDAYASDATKHQLFVLDKSFFAEGENLKQPKYQYLGADFPMIRVNNVFDPQYSNQYIYSISRVSHPIQDNNGMPVGGLALFASIDPYGSSYTTTYYGSNGQLYQKYNQAPATYDNVLNQGLYRIQNKNVVYLSNNVKLSSVGSLHKTSENLMAEKFEITDMYAKTASFANNIKVGNTTIVTDKASKHQVFMFDGQTFAPQYIKLYANQVINLEGFDGVKRVFNLDGIEPLFGTMMIFYNGIFQRGVWDNNLDNIGDNDFVYSPTLKRVHLGFAPSLEDAVSVVCTVEHGVVS